MLQMLLQRPAFHANPLQSGLMKIHLNGKPHELASPCTVAALVESLGYAGKRVAVERNGDIVPKSRHADVALVEGDQIEIVVAVGGG